MSVLVGVIGTAGIALGIAGYVPQIAHLIREQCSEGLSKEAYVTWASAAMLLLAYATLQGDPIFMALQAFHAGAAGLICGLGYRYRNQVCGACAEELEGGEIAAPFRAGRAAAVVTGSHAH